MIYLSDTTLAALNIPLPAIADAIEAALRDKQDGALSTAPKSALLPGGGRYMMTTLAVGAYAALFVPRLARNPGRVAGLACVLAGGLLLACITTIAAPEAAAVTMSTCAGTRPMPAPPDVIGPGGIPVRPSGFNPL